jgi:hypothetical protein
MSKACGWLVVLLCACHGSTEEVRGGGDAGWPRGPVVAPAPVAPVRLLAADGTALDLASLRVRAAVHGPLAFTEVELAFDNLEERIREGTFTIALPDGAAVARLALERDGQWQDAALVEAGQADQAIAAARPYPQGPPLREPAAGAVFTARLFPVVASAHPRLLVAFSHVLLDGTYRLPLRGLPTLAQLEVEVAVTDADGQVSRQRLARERWQPDVDFEADVHAGPGAAAGDLRALVVTVPILDVLMMSTRGAILDVLMRSTRGFQISGRHLALRPVGVVS